MTEGQTLRHGVCSFVIAEGKHCVAVGVVYALKRGAEMVFDHDKKLRVLIRTNILIKAS